MKCPKCGRWRAIESSDGNVECGACGCVARTKRDPASVIKAARNIERGWTRTPQADRLGKVLVRECDVAALSCALRDYDKAT